MPMNGTGLTSSASPRALAQVLLEPKLPVKVGEPTGESINGLTAVPLDIEWNLSGYPAKVKAWLPTGEACVMPEMGFKTLRFSITFSHMGPRIISVHYLGGIYNVEPR
jgi:hypothetical protein